MIQMLSFISSVKYGAREIKQKLITFGSSCLGLRDEVLHPTSAEKGCQGHNHKGQGSIALHDKVKSTKTLSNLG